MIPTNVKTHFIPTSKVIEDESASKVLHMLTQYKVRIDITSLTYDNYKKVLADIKEDIEHCLLDVLTPKPDRERIEKDRCPIALEEEEERLTKKKQEQEAKQQSKVEAAKEAPEELLEIIRQVVENNAKIVTQYKEGNEKAINSLVGQVMKLYKFDAGVVKKLLEENIIFKQRE